MTIAISLDGVPYKTYDVDLSYEPGDEEGILRMIMGEPHESETVPEVDSGSDSGDGRNGTRGSSDSG
jgi:hypothetical protein